jgi:HME family heavy-metal exporter
MFNLLVTQSLKNRLIVLAAAVLLILGGAVLLPRLSVDVLPDLNRPTVVVMTEVEGFAPQEVEQRVTWPIEAAMTGLPGVSRIRSESHVGLSIVSVEFDWSADLLRVRQQVAERLARVTGQIPPAAVPHLAPMTSIMGEIMLIALTSDTLSPMELRELADYTVRPRLLTLPGVAQVIPMGGEVRQIHISPNLLAMQALDIGTGDLEAAVRRFGQNTGGGLVDQYAQEFQVRNVGVTTRLEDLRDMVVATRRGQPVLLQQVASVSFAPRVKRGEAGHNGKPAVIVSVQKVPLADTLRLTRLVEAKLAELQATLPKGVSVNNIQFRQATFIETSIRNLQTVLIEAAVVVAVILVLFLLDWRATAISLTAIPLSMLATVYVFWLMGLTINTMTLGGLAIAIGELVDDAVVDLENIMRRLGENAASATPRPVLHVIAAASQEVRSGIVYATAIVVLVFVPLFALSGIEGRLFAPLGVAYIVAILASLVVSITLTPVLAYYLVASRPPRQHRESRLIRKLTAWNRAALERALEARGPMLTAAGLAVVLASASLMTFPRTFLPPFNEGTITVNVLYNPGISLAVSNRLGQIAERILLEVPEVRSVGRRTGRAELDEHAEGVHSSEFDIDLAREGRPRDAVINDIRQRLSALPAGINVGQPISHRLDHLLTGVRAEIALKIFGDDLDTLRSIAEDFRARMATIPGIADLQIEKKVPVPQVRILIDYQRAALYGLSAAGITQALEGLANGRIVSQIADGPKRLDVVMRLGDTSRSTAGLGDLLVTTPTGPIPLRLVASVSEHEGPSQILREGTRRRLIVMANAGEEGNLGRIVEGVRTVISQTRLPPGYSVSLEGMYQAQEEATRTIGALALVSLALIFLILYQRYRSAVLSLIVMASIPFALIGSVAALWIAGLPLSVASMVGFITLAGIAARNGILKISHCVNLALDEGRPLTRDLVVRGSLERLPPVLITALSAGLALLPLMWGAGEAGREILHPVAVTIFGGLVSATLLDLVLTPLLLVMLGAKPVERLRALRTAEAAHGEKPVNAY